LHLRDDVISEPWQPLFFEPDILLHFFLLFGASFILNFKFQTYAYREL